MWFLLSLHFIFLWFLLYLSLQHLLSSPAFSPLLSLMVQLLQPASLLLLSPLTIQHILHRSDLLQSQHRTDINFINKMCYSFCEDSQMVILIP